MHDIHLHHVHVTCRMMVVKRVWDEAGKLGAGPPQLCATSVWHHMYAHRRALHGLGEPDQRAQASGLRSRWWKKPTSRVAWR
jgi:hypothetical protein